MLSFKRKNFHMFRNTKKGYLTLEAAIFLPIFILGVLTFAYLIKFMTVQEQVMHSFVDEARALSAEAPINPAAALTFKTGLKSRIYAENGNDIGRADIENFNYLYAVGKPGMISVDLNYDVKIRLPISVYKSIPATESLLFRAFIGSSMKKAPMSFEEMEQEKESHLVWIFPASGKKYHDKNCTYIASEPIEMVMTKNIRNKYHSCDICGSKNIASGSKVYVFMKSGKAYHRGSCPSVDKYVISIEKEEAERKGYTPCSKCGGG